MNYKGQSPVAVDISINVKDLVGLKLSINLLTCSPDNRHTQSQFSVP